MGSFCYPIRFCQAKRKSLRLEARKSYKSDRVPFFKRILRVFFGFNKGLHGFYAKGAIPQQSGKGRGLPNVSTLLLFCRKVLKKGEVKNFQNTVHMVDEWPKGTLLRLTTQIKLYATYLLVIWWNFQIVFIISELNSPVENGGRKRDIGLEKFLGNWAICRSVYLSTWSQIWKI